MEKVFKGRVTGKEKIKILDNFRDIIKRNENTIRINFDLIMYLF